MSICDHKYLVLLQSVNECYAQLEKTVQTKETQALCS